MTNRKSWLNLSFPVPLDKLELISVTLIWFYTHPISTVNERLDFNAWSEDSQIAYISSLAHLFKRNWIILHLSRFVWKSSWQYLKWFHSKQSISWFVKCVSCVFYFTYLSNGRLGKITAQNLKYSLRIIENVFLYHPSSQYTIHCLIHSRCKTLKVSLFLLQYIVALSQWAIY